MAVLTFAMASMALAAASLVVATTDKPIVSDYPVKPVPFTLVQVNDGFWNPLIKLNRTVTIPYAFQKCEETGRVRNFVNAAATLRGDDPTGKPMPMFPFDDSDVYKIIEGASYSLSVQPDPKLDAYLDSLIMKIAAAQEPDGYLYTARTINPEHPHSWSGSERWVNEEESSHELYDSGHLFESAVAHFEATGKRTLLNVAIKNANLLVATFGPGKRKIWPGHEVVEMGLVKLYRATRDRRYLDLAKFFLDSRGGRPDGDYWQASIPVVDQTEAVGHAVRAAYLYSGMADVAALTGDQAYVNAIDKIWSNVVEKKLYVTGGIGARPDGEAFGANYFLPNETAYCETCAAVGNVYWNERLFLLHGDAKYIDVMERTLYNGLISGLGKDGKSFFYANPLEATSGLERSPWFDCPCCPGNITRFLPSLPGYVYAQARNTLYVNLFVGGVAKVKLDNGRTVQVAQETRYPWDGDVRLTVRPDRPGLFTVNVRIPGWARNEPVPSDLYSYDQANSDPVLLSVNGRTMPVALEKGFAVIRRRWKAGDVVELRLPMPVRSVRAHNQVNADRGKVALQRGPLVYCIESSENPGIPVLGLEVDDSVFKTVRAIFNPSLLGGVTVLKGKAELCDVHAPDPDLGDFTAVPYYACANRGPTAMAVWIPISWAAVHP